MITDSQRKANRKWREANYDKICVQVRRGFRDAWKVAASARGLSLAALIVSAVEEYLTAHPVENSGVPDPFGNSPDNSPVDR